MSYLHKNIASIESQVSGNGSYKSYGDLPSPRSSGQSNKLNGSVDMEKPYVYEDVLALIGFGKTQWIMLLTCGLLLMLVINETMGMSIITIASQCDFNSSSMDKAIMSAAAFIGKWLKVIYLFIKLK